MYETLCDSLADARFCVEHVPDRFCRARVIASGVLEEAIDGVHARVTVDLADNWSVRFYPMAFYLCSPDCENEEDFDAYGTLLNEQACASLLESHADDESFAEKNGRIVYTTDDGQTGIIAPVDENEYITLIVSPPWNADAVWSRVAYRLF